MEMEEGGREERATLTKEVTMFARTGDIGAHPQPGRSKGRDEHAHAHTHRGVHLDRSGWGRLSSWHSRRSYTPTTALRIVYDWI